tara:strand:+ start:476 stop:1351 length:876 start_codon:yes stop_codon:yes gene_type:complete
MNPLDDKPQKLLDDFLHLYGQDNAIDKAKARKMIAALKAYDTDRKNEEKRDRLVYMNALEDRWYASIRVDGGKVKREPDWSVYDDEYYFVDLWVCWIIYSRKYLRFIRSGVVLFSIETSPSWYTTGELPILEKFQGASTIVDLGCGLGYTTAALKQLFPDSVVYGTNLADTKQYKFCQKMAELHGFSVIPHLGYLGKSVDLIFASEYFEHIFEPIDHLQKVIEQASPRLLYIANSFNTRSIGHFTYYRVGNEYIDQKGMSKCFNKALRHCGYKQLETNLWNNKPGIWQRGS